MLAAMKLGAVVIPATTLLTRDDLLDRFARGRVRHVVAGADNAGEIRRPPRRLHADRGRRRAHPGWAALARRPTTLRPNSRRTARPAPPTRCCSISPRARRRKPKLVLHSHQSYPVGHLVDDVLDRRSSRATST